MSIDDFDDGYEENYGDDLEPEDGYEEDSDDSDGNTLDSHPLDEWEEMAFVGAMSEELADARQFRYREKKEEFDDSGNDSSFDDESTFYHSKKGKSKYGDLIYENERGVGL